MSHRHKHDCCEPKCCCEDYKSYECCQQPIYSCFPNFGCGSGYGSGFGSGFGIIILIIIIAWLCKDKW